MNKVYVCKVIRFAMDPEKAGCEPQIIEAIFRKTKLLYSQSVRKAF